ncbi:MAG: HAD-IA family hydrolase [Candidatus Pacebacteria bacterium]|jgi:FMN phosphatase YigB (HAD superfamily)|nr:HAD-IA family hydrolase [Candidatus Paceibacterota bacterium]MBT4652347.1 HAD-IA family hydrolase [Candidatus Paceibacterota bacterium]MBT6756174.1 HAD-IA family hydrolase [Candidatus Paceibacterota bacterium]MBT6921721.1 HAD-IA family hydrolase [Candidatus Paceibacterota bacterium]
MKKIKFIYFDLGGVLIDHISSLKKIALELNISEEETINLFQKYGDDIDRGTLSWENFEDIFYKKLNPQYKLKSSLHESFVENFIIIQKTHDFINEIKEKIDIGILSNNSGEIFDMIQSKKIIPDINYKSIVISAKIDVIKPEKEIYDYAIDQISFNPNEVLFIDDKEENVNAARSFGWNSIVFDTQKPAESVDRIKEYLADNS